MSKRTVLWILLLIVVVLGVGIRSWELTGRSLWFDEAFSWRLIQFPTTEMVARDAQDVHPPLYYLLLQGWSVVFGTSLLSLRSFSVALAGGTIAAAYLFTSTAFRSRPAGLAAAALIALSGFQIQFAWEARMYTLGTLLALLSSWALLRATRATPQRAGWWVLYGVLAAAFAYTHYYAFFSLAAHALFAAGHLIMVTRGRLGELWHYRGTWLAALSGLIAAGLFAPWIPTFLAQNAQVQDAFWIPALGGWSVPDTFYRMFAPTPGIPRHEWVMWWVIAMVPITATALGWLWLLFGRQRPAETKDGAVFVALSAGVPFGLSIAASFVGQSLYQDRFFVFAHLYILIGLVALLLRIPWRRVRYVVTGLIVCGFLVASVSFWQQLQIPQRPGAHAAARVALEARATDEPIVVSSPFVYFAILHYAEENYQTEGAVQLYSESGEFLHFAGGPILLPDDIVGPDIFAASTERMWLVDTTGFGGSELSLPLSWTERSREVFPEVFAHQGDVIVRELVRSPLPR